MKQPSIVSFSRYLEHVEPENMLAAFREVLPTFELKSEAYEYFRFDGWDIEDTDSPRRSGYAFTPLGERPSFEDGEAYHSYMQTNMQHLERWCRTIAEDIDAAIDFGINVIKPLKLDEEKRINELRVSFPLVAFNVKPPIDRSYHGDQSMLSAFKLYRAWILGYFDDEEAEDVAVIFPSGRTGSIVSVTAAMALLALDKASGAAVKQETYATARFLLDATALVSTAKDMVNSVYLYHAEERKTKERLDKRHSKVRAIKEFALQKAAEMSGKNYSKLYIMKKIYPEVEAYANQLKRPFTDRGPKTVYDWLLKDYSPSNE